MRKAALWDVVITVIDKGNPSQSHFHFWSCILLFDHKSFQSHDDVKIWKHFPHYWLFVWENNGLGVFTAQIWKCRFGWFLCCQSEQAFQQTLEFMMMSWNGNIFRVTGPLWGELPVTGEFPSQRPVMWSFDVSFDLRLNKRLGKQPLGWWFETPSRSLCRHCSVRRIVTDVASR